MYKERGGAKHRKRDKHMREKKYIYIIICLHLYIFLPLQQRNYAYIGNVFSTNNSGEYHGARVCKNKKGMTCGTYNYIMATAAPYKKKTR